MSLFTYLRICDVTSSVIGTPITDVEMGGYGSAGLIYMCVNMLHNVLCRLLIIMGLHFTISSLL